VKGKTMTSLNSRALDTKAVAAPEPAVKASFLARLWRGLVRFDEALNFDPRDDLARRIADLERKLTASNTPLGTSHSQERA
jgi:hypothetical protein